MVVTNFIFVISSILLVAYGLPGPISTLPSMLKHCACTATPGPLFQGSKPPFPTDAWWNGLGVLPQSNTIAGPYPFYCQGLPLGLVFGLPSHRSFDGTSIHQPYNPELLVGASEIPNNINNHKALTWDELSVTVQWFNGGSTMNAYLVQGSPYMTFEYNKATVSITSQSGQFTTINGQKVGDSVSGQKFTVVTTAGSTWLLYSLNGPLTLKTSPTNFVATSAFTGVLRFARMNETSNEAVLDQYHTVYATSASLSYTVQNNVALVSFNWNTKGPSNNVLQMCFPHHRDVLVNPNYAPIQYLTIKGYQKGIVGNVWNLRYPLTQINWFAPRKVDASCIAEIEQALVFEVTNLQPIVPHDFYFWGGSFARAARFALIAEEIGRKDLIQPVVTALEQSFDFWVNGSATDPPGYETGWGGVVAALGVNNTWVDFGNGYYNDHHFHYGYHLYGASVIGKYDRAWFTKNQRYLTELARDIGNPSTQDPYFTVSRMKDWFAGHSWASGIANGAGTRDQESSTEAINGYYGFYTFALVLGNQDIIDWARILLETEIHSVQRYWHLYPNDGTDTPYPEQAFRNLATVGNVMSDSAGAWLFWGNQRSEIAAIQILPATPITEEVVDQNWAKAMYNYCAVEIPNMNVSDSWKSLIYMAHAVYDPHTAYQEAQTISDWGSGNSDPNTLWWIATRPNSAGVCTNGPNNIPHTVYIRSKQNNQYVKAGNGGVLLASTTFPELASIFYISFIPGGYSIQLASNSLYVSDGGGENPLVANRPTASAWETFKFLPQSGGSFAINAGANKEYVTLQTNGLVPNSKTITPSALFTLEAAKIPDKFPNSKVVIQTKQGKFVQVDKTSNYLLATATSQAAATQFNVASVTGGYSFQDVASKSYVSADNNGANPLTANRATVSAWETFSITPVTNTNYYLITANNDNELVAVQANGQMIPKSQSIDDTTEFVLLKVN